MSLNISTAYAAGMALFIVGTSSCRPRIDADSGLRNESSESRSASLDSALLVSTNSALEAATTGGLIAAIKKGIDRSRDAHPKAHGCYDNISLTVNSNIPLELQNQLFQPRKTYQAAIRLSHGASSKTASDLVNDIHGFALKIFLDDTFANEGPISGKLPLVDPTTRQVVGQLDVNELRLSESQGVGERYYQTVDIITINGLHEFMVNGLADYRDFFATGGALKEIIPFILQNKGMLPTTLSNPQLTPALSLINPAIEKGVRYQEFKSGKLQKQMVPQLIVELKNAVFDVMFHRTRGGSDGEIAKLTYSANGHRSWDPLQSSYQSFVPYRFGGDAQASQGPAVKYQIQAIDCSSKEVLDIDNQPTPPEHVRSFLAAAEADNFLGQVIANQVQKRDHCFALKAQPWKKGFPSLDSAAGVWGDRSYTDLAEIRIKQGATQMDASKCEKLSFNPGHGPSQFQGAGEIQRARRLIYAAIETLRNEQDLSAK